MCVRAAPPGCPVCPGARCALRPPSERSAGLRTLRAPSLAGAPRPPGVPGPGAHPPVRLEVLERLLPRTPPPPAMESELLQSPLLGLGEEDEADLTDWNLPLAFMKKRHCEKIEGSKSLAQSWRMKDRVGGRGPRRARGAGGASCWSPLASRLRATRTDSDSSFWPNMHGPSWLVIHRPRVRSN